MYAIRSYYENELPYLWNGLTFNASGTQTATLKNILNCDSLATLNLTVLSAASIENKTICENELPYLWNGLTFNASGTQTATLKNILNCDSLATLNLVITSYSIHYTKLYDES